MAQSEDMGMIPLILIHDTQKPDSQIPVCYSPTANIQKRMIKGIKKADSLSRNFNQSWENVNHSRRIQETLNGKTIKSDMINSILFFFFSYSEV